MGDSGANGSGRLGEGALRREANRPTVAIELPTTRGGAARSGQQPPRGSHEQQPAPPQPPPPPPPRQQTGVGQGGGGQHHHHGQGRKRTPSPPNLPAQHFAPPHGRHHQLTGSRLEAEVLSGRMWSPSCAQLAPPLPDHIPEVFADLQHYASTFEPLLHEEAREGVRSSYQEARNARRGWGATVSRWGRRADGMASLLGCTRC
jgi:hypothetical protein